jgi:hypothetical protein
MVHGFGWAFDVYVIFAPIWHWSALLAFAGFDVVLNSCVVSLFVSVGNILPQFRVRTENLHALDSLATLPRGFKVVLSVICRKYQHSPLVVNLIVSLPGHFSPP